MSIATKKHKQLGMNSSTAANRLRTDLLFKFAISTGHKCFRCNGVLRREDFSIDHKIPWLDSEDPIKLFFDLDNIAFSHLSCNTSLARREIKYPEFVGRRRYPSRYHWDSKRVYDKVKRRKQYERTGK